MEKRLIDSYTPWDKVQIARKIDRPRSRFYIDSIFDNFMEFHGDRTFHDDNAIIGGIAELNGTVVTVIAHNKGNNSKDNIASNFGMPHPEGYRKALRLMKQAEKFNRPIICLVDTPGAYCGISAEERNQGEAIARNLLEMSRLKVPIISGIIGEGGSGGALALAVADIVFMQENTTYSVLSPEGFSSILWKDSTQAEKAANMMKITASELFSYNIIDDIIKEPFGGAHKNPDEASKILKSYLIDKLNDLKLKSINDLINDRYNRFRKFGDI
ncbi:MAG: acetyl-CoA carboxylase carboxyltransferase subunit alpha [Epulopiscium sp. Nele67-Bin004]|nr:MAG: acetyl-CoA carboxylase carboxyltransferase subunit alpha [Epulopiscium sp. Nele67-Bin004]